MADAYLVLQPDGTALSVPPCAAGKPLPVTAPEAQALLAHANHRASLRGDGPYLLAEVTVRAPVPSAAQARAWLAAHGWSARPPGRGGALWNGPDRACVAVPHEDGDDFAINGAVARIAAAENRPQWQVAAEMAAMEAAGREV
jgi:hypothetical protein